MTAAEPRATRASDATPDISVVVATYNRSQLLPRLVEAVKAQDHPGPVELIIVDDASTDDTKQVLEALAAANTGLLRPLHLADNSGPAVARNHGWRSARASFIAFTDDDCVPRSAWLSGLLKGLSEADLAQGATHPDPEQLENTGPFSRTLEVRFENGYYATCNMGYRRSELERLGGFDERFRHPAGEDTDLAWRALDSGAISTFMADAVVYHDVRPSNLLTKLRDTARWEGVVLAVRQHPDLRYRLHRRWFWKPSHPPTIAAAAGLVALVAARGPLGRLVGAALCAPYVSFRLRRQPLVRDPAGRVTSLPGAFVADAAEVGVTVSASVRYRTLLL